MKKIISLILVSIIALSMTACMGPLGMIIKAEKAANNNNANTVYPDDIIDDKSQEIIDSLLVQEFSK